MAKAPQVINPNVDAEDDAEVSRKCVERGIDPKTLRVTIMHISDPASTVGYKCGVVDYGAFTVELIAERWRKAGRYVGDVHAPGAGNLKRIVFGISPELIAELPPPPPHAGQVAGTPPAPAASGLNVETVLLAMMKSQGDLLTALITRPTPPPPPPPPPSSISDTILTTLLTHTLQKTPVGELVEAAKSFGIKLGGNGGGGSGRKDDEDDAPVGGAIIEGLKLVREMWQGSNAATPAPATPTAPTTAASNAPAPEAMHAQADATQPPPPAPKDPPVSQEQFLADVLPALIDAAKVTPPNVPAAAAMVAQKAKAAGVQLEAWAGKSPKSLVLALTIMRPEARPAADFIEQVLAHIGKTLELQRFYVRAVGLAVDAAGDAEPDVEATATSIEGLAERFKVPDSQFAGMDVGKEIDEILAVFPRVAPHREWLTKVWTELKERANDEDQDEE